MSLRALHIVFIILSTMLFFGYGWWQYSVGHSMFFAILSFAFGFSLTGYFFWFISKVKKHNS